MKSLGSSFLFGAATVALVLSVSSPGGFAAPQQANVLGSATYRERMVLPPNAVLEATLEDVSRADAAAVEIGRVRLEKSGMPPFRFSIPYDRAGIKPDRSYAVRARILVDGKLMFVTTQAYPVLTRGSGNRVEMTLQRSTSTMEGMFRYMADAAVFTDCRTGERWPVAMEAGYLALEKAYTETRQQPGEELKVNFQGQLAMKPKADGGGQVFHVIVDRYIGISPGETCSASTSSPPLQETHWRLTRLEGKPVVLASPPQEPHVVFKALDNRVTGSTGCNTLTGIYRLNGSNLNLTSIAITKMACLQGMDIESGLFTALGSISKWRIVGQYLELLTAEDAVAARFEAKPK